MDKENLAVRAMLELQKEMEDEAQQQELIRETDVQALVDEERR